MNAQMRIYTPLGSDGHELCHPVDPCDFEAINVSIDGTPRQSKWKQLTVRVVRNDGEKDLIESDAPWLGVHALIFRARAVELMKPTLRTFGELLPLKCSDADLWIYNPGRLADALDESASSVLRFKDGRLMLIQRHVFNANAVRNVDVFKIPNLRVSPTFVGQRFVDRWHASGLKGLEFKQVWTSSN